MLKAFCFKESNYNLTGSLLSAFVV